MGKISVVEKLKGRSGLLSLTRVSIQALEVEDHLLFAAVDGEGRSIDQETCEKLFEVDGRVLGSASLSENDDAALGREVEVAKATLLAKIADRNSKYFDEEIDKLERWAEDLKAGLEQELKDLDAEIKSTKKEAKLQPELDAKLALHRKAKALEADRSRKRRVLYDAQDEIDRRKESLITDVEARLKKEESVERLFSIRWTVS